jgi:hypothetical protein
VGSVQQAGVFGLGEAFAAAVAWAAVAFTADAVDQTVAPPATARTRRIEVYPFKPELTTPRMK